MPQVYYDSCATVLKPPVGMVMRFYDITDVYSCNDNNSVAIPRYFMLIISIIMITPAGCSFEKKKMMVSF